MENGIYLSLIPWAEDWLGDYQAGFRRIDRQIFILKQLLQKMWLFDTKVYELFINFQKAYDSIHRDSFLNTIKPF